LSVPADRTPLKGGHMAFTGLPPLSDMGANEYQLFVPPDPDENNLNGLDAAKHIKDSFGLASEVRKANPGEFILCQASDGSQVVVDEADWVACEHRTAVAAYFLSEGCYVHFMFLKLGKFGAVLIPNWKAVGVNHRKLYNVNG
jgi:hypothetical protein